MEVLFTVSPDYLDTLERETKKYTFALQGYRDIEVAIESLHLSNAKDILGFAYVADELPDYKLMHKFIKKIDLTITQPTKLILAIRDQESFEEFKENYRGSKVIIEAISGFEVLNDIIINNSVVGTIIKTRYTPYLDDMQKPERLFPARKYLSYTKVIDKRLLRIIEPVRKLNTLEDTVRYDDILSRTTNKDGMFYDLRLAYVKAHFGIYTDITKYGEDDRFVMMKVLDNFIREVIRNERRK